MISCAGQSPGQRAIRASMQAAEPAGIGLFRPGIRGREKHEILDRHGEADQPPNEPLPVRPAAPLRHQILHARSGTTGRGIYSLPLLHANQTGPGHWGPPVQ